MFSPATNVTAGQAVSVLLFLPQATNKPPITHKECLQKILMSVF